MRNIDVRERENSMRFLCRKEDKQMVMDTLAHAVMVLEDLKVEEGKDAFYFSIRLPKKVGLKLYELDENGIAW